MEQTARLFKPKSAVEKDKTDFGSKQLRRGSYINCRPAISVTESTRERDS